MSTQKRAFDPLASLFDLPEGEEGRRAAQAPPARPPAEGDDVPDPAGLAPKANPPAAAPPAPAQAPASAPGPDPAELAKILAKAAAARAAAAKPAPKAAPAPGKPAPAPAGRFPPPGGSRAPVQPAAKPVAQAAKPGAEATSSRLGAAPPPRRALSLDEALAAARAEEEARAAAAAKPAVKAESPPAKANVSPAPAAPPAAAAPAPSKPLSALRPDQLADVVAAHVSSAVPEIGAVYIANALLMDDRVILTALWKAHRARFAHGGEVDAAVACTMVVRALGSVPAGQLAAAHAVTDKTDWLVWIDLDKGPVAAFRNARALFAGGG